MISKNIAILPPVSSVLKQYNITANKKLGQHFLFDLNLTDKIVRNSGIIEGHCIIEIGPGPGALTRSILAANPKHLIAIDTDERFIKMLDETLKPVSNGILELIKEDALKFNYLNIEKPIKLISNLPYNISTQLLFLWLKNISHFASLTLMFQKDVADKIMAQPRTSSYGKMSIISQRLCHIENICNLGPQAFSPPPKVDSSVLRFIPYKEPLFSANEEKLDLILRTCFGLRRKTLKVSLKSIFSNPEEILNRLSINPLARPEELNIEQFCLLSRQEN